VSDQGNGDRFEDLSVGERLAERDRTHPEPSRPPEVPRPGNKYAWAVGIVAVMLLAVLLFAETLPNQGKGLKGPENGQRLKVFAAPSATGNLEGDANVCQKEPCPKQAGPRPACQVVAKDVVNLCQLREHPLVLTFVFDRGADCLPQVDRTERIRGDLPDVRFATVFFTRKKYDEIAKIVRGRRWVQPVAVDQDGAIANLYGVGGCPTTIFAKPGGVVANTELGNITEDDLRAQAERLR
jgi:hypothetical protein